MGEADPGRREPAGLATRGWTRIRTLSLLSGLGVLLAMSLLQGFFGTIGLGAGVAIAILWILLPVAYVYAAAHVVVLPVMVDPQSVLGPILIESALLIVLLGPAVESSHRGPYLRGLFAFGSGLGGLIWVGESTGLGRWVTVALGIGVAGLTAYGIVRYAHVSFHPTDE